MLAYDTVPIWRVLRVEDGLDVLSDVLLCVFSIHDVVDLFLELALHLFVHLADDIVNHSVCAHIACSPLKSLII